MLCHPLLVRSYIKAWKEKETFGPLYCRSTLNLKIDGNRVITRKKIGTAKGIQRGRGLDYSLMW